MSSGESVAENVIDADRQVAVLVPCYNEEHAVAKVVADFRAALPAAAIYVYDNNSTDRTVEVARAAGAIVRRETYQGKGHVVRRMFNDIAWISRNSYARSFPIKIFAVPLLLPTHPPRTVPQTASRPAACR